MSKRIFIAMFCFGLMFNQPAKAFWPVFDFSEIVPVYSQVSTGINQLKSLKEQLKELEETFKALGKEVANIAAFAKDISNTVASAANMVAEGANLLNENLGTNITLGEKAQDLASKVSKANKEVATAVKGATENIAKGTKDVGKISKGINELSELKTKSDKFMKENSSYLDPNDPDPSQDESNSTPTTEPVEEEEEEEEITEDEEAQTIEAIKENIDFALKESKSLNVQFNDVLDISMNTIYQNIASNNKTIDNMIFVINKAENLTEEDKTTVKKEIESIKQRQETLSVNLVDIINGMKEVL